jgi:ABC-type nitrate/sulfonate/bicarbonate transport system substrate-binding protein
MAPQRMANPLRAPGALVVLSLCLALLLSVSISHSAGNRTSGARVLVPQTTAALPFLAMARDNALPGLKVDFFNNHAQALALLLRGETDMLLSGTSQGWENRLDGSPIVMIDTGVWGVSSLVGKDPGIKGFADLKGKRIALPFPGSPLDFQTRALLAFDKIDPDKDLTISYGAFPQSVPRLLAGQLDAAALPEPLATTVVMKNGLVRLAEYAAAWGRLTGGDRQSPQVSLFATETWARDNAGLIAQLLTAWDAASRAVAADPAAAAGRFAESLSVEPAILEEAARKTLFAVPPMAENRARVLAYYQAVSRFFPGGARQLDQRFILAP